MRILFAAPPLTPLGDIQPPVGLAALAAWAKTKGHDVCVLDLDLAQRLLGRQDWPECLSLFRQAMAQFCPEVAAVTSMYSNSLQAERLIDLAKDCDPDIVTLAGGSHFGALPVQALERQPNLDFAIKGEGESALLALLTQLEADRDWAGVPSLAWRDGNQVKLNPAAELIDLNLLPNPWAVLEDELPVRNYIDAIDGEPIAYVEAGRGCPFACSFCATAPFWERRFRVKTPAQIVEEIRSLHGVGYEKFVLVHDLLTVNRKFIAAFCEAMLESRLPVQWMANARTDLAMDGLLPLMKAAGCWKLFFGIESASSRVQTAIAKDLDAEQSTRLIRDLGQHGLTSTCSFVIGFPDESVEELSRSVQLGARLKMLGAETVQFHRLRIWPPAPLSFLEMARQFDQASLQIEYPYFKVAEEDLEAIRNDPAFFGGYFPPDCTAAAPWQISQLELFAHHAVALAPMTIYAMEALRPGQLVRHFFESLDEDGPIPRQSLDLDGGDIGLNWRTIRHRITLIADRLDLTGSDRLVYEGLLEYEHKRTEFTQTAKVARPADKPSAMFSVAVDIGKSIEAIIADDLDPDVLLSPTLIAFTTGSHGRHMVHAGPSSNAIG